MVPTHPIRVSPRILNNIAGMYDNVNKCIAEFVDNSLDSAEYWYNQDTNSYSKPIFIQVSLFGTNMNNSSVVIKDNCEGMTKEKLIDVFQEIGNSDKKTSSFTNGQFGFGMFSFQAFFKELSIHSRFSGIGYGNVLSVSKRMLNNRNASIDDPKKSNKLNSSGTLIDIKRYTKRNWKNITKDSVVDTLNKHFERILTRENLRIVVVGRSGKQTELKPHNYDDYPGHSIIESADANIFAPFDKENKIKLFIARRGQENAEVSGEKLKGMRAHFRVTDELIEDKPFYLIVKGRRINDVRSALGFGTGLDMAVWNSKQLTGYLDLANFAKTELSREKIKSGDSKKSVIEYLQRKEEDIKELLNAVHQRREDKDWENVAEVVNDIIKDLTKEFNVAFSKLSSTSGKKAGAGGTEGGARIRGKGKKVKGENPSDGPGFGGGKGGTGMLGDDDFKDDISNKPKKSHLSIDYDSGNPPTQRSIDGKDPILLSTELQDDGVLIFFTQHKDFKSRVGKRKGVSKLTPRLVTFMACRIAVHFLDKFFLKNPDKFEQYSIKQLEHVGGFVLKFENALQPYINKSIYDLKQ